jgi:hypothetical protein
VVPRLVQRRALQGQQSTSVLVAYVEAWSRHRDVRGAPAQPGQHARGVRLLHDVATAVPELQLTPAAEAKPEAERARKAAGHADEDPFD